MTRHSKDNSKPPLAQLAKPKKDEVTSGRV